MEPCRVSSSCLPETDLQGGQRLWPDSQGREETERAFLGSLLFVHHVHGLKKLSLKKLTHDLFLSLWPGMLHSFCRTWTKVWCHKQEVTVLGRWTSHCNLQPWWRSHPYPFHFIKHLQEYFVKERLLQVHALSMLLRWKHINAIVTYSLVHLESAMLSLWLLEYSILFIIKLDH